MNLIAYIYFQQTIKVMTKINIKEFYRIFLMYYQNTYDIILKYDIHCMYNSLYKMYSVHTLLLDQKLMWKILRYWFFYFSSCYFEGIQFFIIPAKVYAAIHNIVLLRWKLYQTNGPCYKVRWKLLISIIWTTTYWIFFFLPISPRAIFHGKKKYGNSFRWKNKKEIEMQWLSKFKI